MTNPVHMVVLQYSLARNIPDKVRTVLDGGLETKASMTNGALPF